MYPKIFTHCIITKLVKTGEPMQPGIIFNTIFYLHEMN
jgi:hypothetical protein